MLVHQHAETVLPAKAGEDGALVGRSLAVEIELGGPPALRAIFEFRDARQKLFAVFGRAGQPFISISRFPGSSMVWS